MNISKTLISISAFAALSFFSSVSNAGEVSATSIATSAKNAIFKNYSETEVKKYLHNDYIQHNPNIASGIDPILKILPNLKESKINVKTHRVFQDGNFVVMHNSFKNAKALGAEEVVSFDIWKVDGNKVVEHWDAITPVVSKTASGRSQIDGPTEVVDKHKTKQNKQLVEQLVKEVFIKGNVSTITDYISTEQYDQHNPMVKDGLKGLSEAIEWLSSQNNMFVYKKLHKVLGEGNFVLVQVEGEWSGKPHVFYDLFRVENDKIVEHWDIVNEIPEKMAHSNGLF